MSASPSASRSTVQLLRDDRFLQIVGQIVFALVLIAAVYGLVTSIFGALAARNLTPNFGFLQLRAGFDISEKPAWYSADSTYWQAYTVGLTNTIRVVVLGLVITTVVGVIVGILLLSTNWLVRTIFGVYVELLRNVPLLLWLLATYFIVMLGLPQFQQSLSFPQEGLVILPYRWFAYIVGALIVWIAVRRVSPERHRWRRWLVWGALAVVVLIELVVRVGLIGGGPALRVTFQPWAYFSIRGLAFPEIQTTDRVGAWAIFLAAGLILAAIEWVFFGRMKERTGQRAPRSLIAVIILVIAGGIGWVFISQSPAVYPTTDANGQPITVPLSDAVEQGMITDADAIVYRADPLVMILPAKSNFRYTAGMQVTPELMALLLGLSLYTSAFIAEIVRAGILAVPKGQLEAARALGLKTNDVLWYVVLPQALRVIIPPLGNQYLNLAKNSSLAIPIAFADLFLVTSTIMNQSGQSVTGMTMMMLTYLVISLIIAATTNFANRRFQLVTR